MPSEELIAAFGAAEAIANECLNALHRAIFEFDSVRRPNLLREASEKLAEIKELADKFPAIKADTDEVEQHLEILKRDHPVIAQAKIKEKIGCDEFRRLQAEFDTSHNYLGRAAELRASMAKHRISGERDAYWRDRERLKTEYIGHANHNGFSRTDSLRLVTSVFKDSADLLRIEGKHKEALRHYMYFLAHAAPATASELKRLSAFLSRASAPASLSKAAIDAIDCSEDVDDFRFIDKFLAHIHN